MAHGNLCRHGWVPSQPLLVIVSPFHPSPPLPPPALPPHFPLSISLSSHSSSFGSPPHPHSPHFSFSKQGSSGHCSLPTPLHPLHTQRASSHLLHPPHLPPFSLRGCSSRCTLTARGYCVWKCSCWTRRPLQSTGQRLEHLCLKPGTFDLQLTLQTCHRG